MATKYFETQGPVDAAVKLRRLAQSGTRRFYRTRQARPLHCHVRTTTDWEDDVLPMGPRRTRRSRRDIFSDTVEF